MREQKKDKQRQNEQQEKRQTKPEKYKRKKWQGGLKRQGRGEKIEEDGRETRT